MFIAKSYTFSLGRFKTVSQISGLWRLDVFNGDVKLKYEVAPTDGIEEYDAELEALHMFIATMMFVTLMIISLTSMIRRNNIVADDDGGGTAQTGLFQRRGLSRRVIDSIPLKRYTLPSGPSHTVADRDVVDDVSLSTYRENGLEENLDCCSICLVPYEEGVSEIRTLPCGHVFDRECIDAWFQDHVTCPTCRQDISNTAPAHDPRRRFHNHWDRNSDSLSTIEDGEQYEDSTISTNEDSAISTGEYQEEQGDQRFPQGLRRLFTGRRRQAGNVMMPISGEDNIELV